MVMFVYGGGGRKREIIGDDQSLKTMEIRNFLERWTSSPTDPRVYMSLCFRFFDLYSCVTRERACVHSVLEERVNGSTQRIRDPFMLLFPFSTLFILVLAPFFSISRRSSSSSYFYLFSSVHRQVRARWPRCGIAWKSESRVSLRKTFYFLFLLYSPTRGENLRNLHTLEIPIFISFYFILFYFTLFYFFFIFFLFFVCFMMRAERFVEARHLRADTIPCCFHADVLRLPSSSASVDSVAASPMSPRGYLLRDGGCWSAATPSSFFFFFFGRWTSDYVVDLFPFDLAVLPCSWLLDPVVPLLSLAARR